MITWRKAIAVVTLAPFLTCSGCLPSGWLPGARPPADGPNTSDADTAAEVPVIREAQPEPIPLTTGPLPSAAAPDAAASSAGSASPAARAAEVRGPGGGAEAQMGSYRIGEDDELEISVYGDNDLSKTQAVRPDGKLAFPLIGDVQAAGLTPDELRARITEGVARYVRNPQVTVLVTKYLSRRVSVLGEVKTPGLLRTSSDLTVLEAISRAGGLTDSANLQATVLVRNGETRSVDLGRLLRGDLSQNMVLQTNDTLVVPDIKEKKVFVLGQVNKPEVVILRPEVTLVEAISRAGGVTSGADLPGALLVRAGRILPVNFDKLLRLGDVSQNVLLAANDIVLIPDVKDRKVFVLGEVKKPLVVALQTGSTLVEAIASAGGFTADAQPKSVVVVRGGLGAPRLLTVDVLRVTRGKTADNVVLEPGDIVYVPSSFVSDVVKFFQTITTILTPLVLTATGIVLGSSAQAVLTGAAASTPVGAAVSVSPP
jgi:protein involved in polysaccharide export with SLBB domain